MKMKTPIYIRIFVFLILHLLYLQGHNFRRISSWFHAIPNYATSKLPHITRDLKKAW